MPKEKIDLYKYSLSLQEYELQLFLMKLQYKLDVDRYIEMLVKDEKITNEECERLRNKYCIDIKSLI